MWGATHLVWTRMDILNSQSGKGITVEGNSETGSDAPQTTQDHDHEASGPFPLVDVLCPEPKHHTEG